MRRRASVSRSVSAAAAAVGDCKDCNSIVILIVIVSAAVSVKEEDFRD